MSVFPFIEAEKLGEHGTVNRSCELLKVSRSAFYAWHKHVPTPRQLADEELAARITEIYDDSRGTYGWPRVHAQLRRQFVRTDPVRVDVRGELHRP